MIDPNKPAFRPAHYVGRSEDGNEALFESATTPEADTCRTHIVCSSNKVVPIVFVPGIMGSNLKAKVDIKDRTDRSVVKASKPIWRVDGIGSLLGWLTKGADEYQLRLRSIVAEVDKEGRIPKKGLLCQDTQHSPLAPLTEPQLRERGWGEVSAMFYLGFLDYLQHWLNNASKDFSQDGWPDNAVLKSIKQTHTGDKPLGVALGHVPTLSAPDIELLLNCDNPVHAFGYNWLQSNAMSGRDLNKRIDEIIQGYRAQGKQCDQVILVTHSMGGLVARAACMVHGAEGKVAGVFHGVMPTDGAAATYKRMVSGFGGEGGWLMGWVTANILGPRGDFTTPTLALNAGPLELLPNTQYNQGEPWLFVKDAAGQKLALPTKGGDPYDEIYKEETLWWKPCNEAWMNPAKLKEAGSFIDYGRTVDDAAAFHSDLHAKGDFHAVTHAHYGADIHESAYATVTWQLDKALTDGQHSALQRHDLSDSDMRVTLSIGDIAGTGTDADNKDRGAANGLRVKATLSAPDAPGDGTVPAAASAARVNTAAQAGVWVSDTGFAHDASFDPKKPSMGPKAALHAVVHILKTTGVAA